ncbi:MAG: hypothetical protein HY873_04975, partial [Chloroflexi bacterium]|nr:hypothetical protein [Chloroflexota bacterium]
MKKMTEESAARALQKLFKEGKAYVGEDGLPCLTEPARTEAIHTMGGRDIVNVAYALRNAIESE